MVIQKELAPNGFLKCGFMPYKRQIMCKEKKALIKMGLILALVFIVMYLFVALADGEDNFQRYYMAPPYKGQISGYSDWTIPPSAWNELTNCYIDEQGKIVMRPGFYCWLDRLGPLTIEGSCYYKFWDETGFKDYIIFHTYNVICKTTLSTGNTNTRISQQMATGYTDESSFNNDGIPSWVTYYNNIFMANGHDGAIQYNANNALIAEIGRSYAKCSVEFQDSDVIEIKRQAGDGVNVEGSDYLDASGHYWLHFRVGMDLTITNSNNNGTYEIIEVDANLITVSTTSGGDVTWSSEESDTNVYLYAYGFPDDLSTSRTVTVTYTNSDDVTFYGTNRVCAPPGHWRLEGFEDGMTLTVSGSSNNDGTYTIIDTISDSVSCMEMDSNFPVAETDSSTITFTGTKTVSNGMDCFNPLALAGHKGRLFAGGIPEKATKLYWSQSVFRDQYYWDLWRDSYGIEEGTGNYDIRDKIVGLIGEWRGMLVILCENSILYLRGDDPGFDILTPYLFFNSLEYAEDIILSPPSLDWTT